MKTVSRNFAAENWEASDRVSGTPTKNDVVYIDCDERGETIASVWLPCRIGREEEEVEQEALALARVIAAAPALLDACLGAMDFFEDGTPEDSISPAERTTRRALLAAIAKATANA